VRKRKGCDSDLSIYCHSTTGLRHTMHVFVPVTSNSCASVQMADLTHTHTHTERERERENMGRIKTKLPSWPGGLYAAIYA
jgi:hypothetical protein